MWLLRPKRKPRRPRSRIHSQHESQKLNRPVSQPTTPKESEITISIILESSKIAETILRSVIPEAQQTPGYRSSTRLEARGHVLTMHIQAKDLVALRAASNSFLRFVSASLRAIEVVAPFYRTRRIQRSSGAQQT
ncbi:hypothetical protein E6H33_11470 [Candidatus Bathyarchaeota archaeon]|nr:MAG: hypothetical protein E6H33_11470 [Candidatus Bathyarchaeota archaeon]